MNRRQARYNAKKQNSPLQPKEQSPVSHDSVSSDAAAPSSTQLPFSSEYALESRKVVDLFLENFKYILAADDLQEMIQKVKGDLYNRDYLSAFDSDDKRFAYVARWSPARALAYASLFSSLEPLRQLLADPNKETSALCIGGGAASELVALGSMFACLKQPNGDTPSKLHLNVIDIADWSTIVGSLSSYISQKWFYNPAKFTSEFVLGDVLSQNAESLRLALLDFITLLFTTNELFCEKKTETIKLLQMLSSHCRKGALLLIAESAGSYSHITVGSKRFPVQFLIDTILAGKPGASDGAWEIVDQNESCWYRINTKEVEYPIKLENMRFFYRLYRKN